MILFFLYDDEKKIFTLLNICIKKRNRFFIIYLTKNVPLQAEKLISLTNILFLKGTYNHSTTMYNYTMDYVKQDYIF